MRAVQAIAGLLPVHLLLKRMATRSMGRLLSLSANHPLRALLSRRLAGDVLPAHSASIANMSPALRRKTRGSLMEVDSSLPIMANAMDVFASEARPGYRLIDTWQESIKYDLETREGGAAAAAAPDPAPFDGMVFEPGLDYLDQVQRWWAALPPPAAPAQPAAAHVQGKKVSAREAHLNSIYKQIVEEQDTVYVGTDGSQLDNPAHQAVAAAIVSVGSSMVAEPRSACGRVTTSEMELIAIQSGLTVAMSRHDCLTIYVFTDLLSAIWNTTNIFRHSSKGGFSQHLPQALPVV